MTKIRTWLNCPYCNRPISRSFPPQHDQFQTRDHITPRSQGGAERSRGNCVMTCRACNELKGDMALSQWAEFISANANWWRMYRSQRLRGLRLFIATKRVDASWGS